VATARRPHPTAAFARSSGRTSARHLDPKFRRASRLGRMPVSEPTAGFHFHHNGVHAHRFTFDIPVSLPQPLRRLIS